MYEDCTSRAPTPAAFCTAQSVLMVRHARHLRYVMPGTRGTSCQVLVIRHAKHSWYVMPSTYGTPYQMLLVRQARCSSIQSFFFKYLEGTYLQYTVLRSMTVRWLSFRHVQSFRGNRKSPVSSPIAWHYSLRHQKHHLYCTSSITLLHQCYNILALLTALSYYTVSLLLYKEQSI